MNQTINNYEILPTSSFFNFSDILTIGTIIAAFITLYFTIRNNNKTLKKTLEYETNKRKLLEFNEVAISIKATEYELRKLEVILKSIDYMEGGKVVCYLTKDLFRLINSTSDKSFYMESQFDLKSYNMTIKKTYKMIDGDAKYELTESLSKLYKTCLNNDDMNDRASVIYAEETNEKIKEEIKEKNLSDFTERIDIINVESNRIASKELATYLNSILSAKKALVDAIAEINTTDFN